MKQNNFGWFIFVICVVAWSLWEINPPTSRDLVNEFTRRAVNKDTAFTNILDQAKSLHQANTNLSEFVVLETAAGTNGLQGYFPYFIGATNAVKPNLYILNKLQRDAAGKIKLGLDLQGGTEFLVSMDTNVLARDTNSTQPQSVATSEAVNQAISVLRKRIDQFGVAEPVIQSAGENQILVQLPGLSQADVETAKQEITKPAFLEFRMVRDDSDDLIDGAGHQRMPIPPGFEIVKSVKPGTDGKPQIEAAVVSKKPVNGLVGDIIKSARVGFGDLGQPEIDFVLNPEAAMAFGQVTRDNVGHRMAIILDGELVTAPRINSPIETGSGQITGSYSLDDARSVADAMQNPLRAPLSILYSSNVDPTLGKDSIHSGILASIYGVVFVSLFMLVYYRISGIAANIALLTNVIIILGVMCAAGATFTLPGIAGAVLTVGMAVDANVLIYERIREELAKGKTLRGAIDAGYGRAFGTIFDSHVTTLISSIILIWQGTGEIKGFGVTLTIGVAASLFTALVVTRLIFNFLMEKNLIKSLSMMHIIKSSKVDFLGMAKPLFILTWLFAVAGLGFGAFRGSQLFGVDFRGGDSGIYSFTQRVDEDKIRAAIGERDSQIQYQKDAGGSGAATLRITSPLNTANKVTADLIKSFPEAHFQLIGEQQVGAVMGEEIRQSAVVASFFAMIGILFYVALRYEFSFAVAAIVAVLHDVLFTIGAYCLANAISGREFNATVMAAVLTIIGFSINDKIVIFDRIREDLKLGMRGSFKEVINQALNQTLSRTIITSGTVFLATAALFIFGGGAINDFAFTFLIGIIVGTYSSIYIASALVLWWHKGQRPNLTSPMGSLSGSNAPQV